MGDIHHHRLVDAVAGHDGDPPRRRWLRLPVPSLLTGVMIAALTAGGLAAYAMITGRC